MIEVLECEIKEMKSEIDARSIEDINDKTWETLQEIQILHSIVLIILFRHKNDNAHTLKKIFNDKGDSIRSIINYFLQKRNHFKQ